MANWLQNSIAEWVARLPYPVLDKVLFGKHALALPLQIALQHAIGGERESSFMLDGQEFHCHTSQMVFFQRSNYERAVIDAVLPHMTADAVVYDVGANIGFWLVRAATRCRNCVGFEPLPANIALLRRNTAHLPGVSIEEAAVSSFNGTIRLSEDGTRTSVGTGETEVRCLTLDSFEGPAPTLIIIDVEGHAGEVLAGAMNLTAKHRPTCVIELHNTAEQDRVLSSLSALGYGFKYLEHGRKFPFHVLATPK